jgi:hypothetical protein
VNLSNVQPAFGDSLYLMLGALVLFLVLFMVYLWRAGWGRGGEGRRLRFNFRSIPGYDATNEGLARASETGRAVHTSPGTGGVGGQGVDSATTLAGMIIVESMARVAAITGAPVEATTNDAVAYALTDNALRRGYQRAGWSLQNESGGARFLTHDDPLAYVAGAAEIVEQHQVSHAVAAGRFGPEVLILTEAQRRSGAQQIIGSTDHQGLAVTYITADHTLIGEEIFASGAYLEKRTTHSASLLAQDGLRWIVILVIIGGFIALNILGMSWTDVLTLLP